MLGYGHQNVSRRVPPRSARNVLQLLRLPPTRSSTTETYGWVALTMRYVDAVVEFISRHKTTRFTVRYIKQFPPALC